MTIAKAFALHVNSIKSVKPKTPWAKIKQVLSELSKKCREQAESKKKALWETLRYKTTSTKTAL